MTRRTLTAALVALTALLAPSVAQATGNHQPSPNPPQASCPCCQNIDQRVDQLTLVFNQKITQVTQRQDQTDGRVTNLEQRLSVLEQTIANLQQQITNVDARVTTIINTPDPLACNSRRVYRFLIRRDIEGSRVVRVDRVLVRGQERYGSVRRTSTGRFQVTADYRGVRAPAGQLRTVTSFVTLANGRRVRTVQFVRLCLVGNDGQPNDTPSQSRAGI